MHSFNLLISWFFFSLLSYGCNFSLSFCLITLFIFSSTFLNTNLFCDATVCIISCMVSAISYVLLLLFLIFLMNFVTSADLIYFWSFFLNFSILSGKANWHFLETRFDIRIEVLKSSKSSESSYSSSYESSSFAE